VSWPIPGPFPSGEPNSASDADLVAFLLALLGARRTLGGPGGFRWSSPGSSLHAPTGSSESRRGNNPRSAPSGGLFIWSITDD
jgi:hypothetical protein